MKSWVSMQIMRGKATRVKQIPSKTFCSGIQPVTADIQVGEVSDKYSQIIFCLDLDIGEAVFALRRQPFFQEVCQDVCRTIALDIVVLLD